MTIERPRLSASITMMFREVPFLERFEQARKAGFAGVEIQLLSEGEPKAIREAARAAELAVVLINVDMADFPSGGPGLSGVPGREARFGDAVAHACDAAAMIGARFVHLGPSRVPADMTREACLDCYQANAAAAIEYADGAPFRFVIEGMNRIDVPDALFGTVDEAAAMADRHSGKLGLLFDIYHIARCGEDPVAAYRRHRAAVHHLQFSDLPGRHEPGSGTIDFPQVFGGIAAAGYDGWWGAEYTPSGASTGDSLGWIPMLD